jgi:transposase InsO family protein
MKSVDKSKVTETYSLSEISSEYDLTRDAYYKYQKRFVKQEKIKQKVISLVKERRNTLPREGCRKLHNALEQPFKKNDLKVGRDKLFDILRAENMLVTRKKASFKTTNSYHHFHKYNNLIKDIEIERINQVWVSDITYIRTVKGFCYLALITDFYSRKIIGFDVSDTLELTGSLRALKLALRRSSNIDGLIHHSDRGVQYCSNQYVNELKKKNIRISMTEEKHCYENAIAERVNGILKDEFYLDQTFFDVSHAQRAAKNAIKLYNEVRLHLSLNFKTPENVYKSIA